MNTFLNAQVELSGWTKEVVNDLKKVPLNARINKRGEREQRAAKMLPHYYPNAAKRLRRVNK